MVSITALYLILLAFSSSTEAFSIPRNSLGAPLYMSGDEARTLAKNSGSLHTRDQTLCQPVSIDDLQSSIGETLQEIENIATNLWGGDWDTVTTNPPQFSDSPAQACYPTDNEFSVIWDTPISDQSCPIMASQLSGYVGAGNSSGLVQIYQGASATLQTMVTKTVTWTIGFEYILKVLASFLPATPAGYFIFDTSVSISNTESWTTSTTQDTRTTVQEIITCKGPAEAEVDIALRQCTLSGHIDVPVTVNGWVWFFYHNKRNGHYDWAVNFDNVDVSKRQSNMSVQVTGDSSSYGDYVATCGCGR